MMLKFLVRALRMLLIISLSVTALGRKFHSAGNFEATRILHSLTPMPPHEPVYSMSKAVFVPWNNPQPGLRSTINADSLPRYWSPHTRTTDLNDLRRGQGSKAPTCDSKCGSCSPCLPIHVPINGGAKAQNDYYPEVWRCQCGGQQFIP